MKPCASVDAARPPPGSDDRVCGRASAITGALIATYPRWGILAAHLGRPLGGPATHMVGEALHIWGPKPYRGEGPRLISALVRRILAKDIPLLL
jgi:hypothetical protein